MTQRRMHDGARKLLIVGALFSGLLLAPGASADTGVCKPAGRLATDGAAVGHAVQRAADGTATNCDQKAWSLPPAMIVLVSAAIGIAAFGGGSRLKRRQRPDPGVRLSGNGRMAHYT